jgi:DNA-directed RNA polymerase specialized sigma24 family protein
MDAVKLGENQAFLNQFVETEADTLLNILRAYAMRMGIATPQTAPIVASELLSDLVIEALRYAHRYDAERRPMAWLLGIALNLIRRRKVSHARLERREPLLRDLYHTEAEQLSDGELFDRFVALTVHSPAHRLEENEQVHALLA